MPRSRTLLARGANAREALRALFAELSAVLADEPDPDLVVVVQARAESDGSGFVAEAGVWHLRRYRDGDTVPPPWDPPDEKS